MKYIERIAAFFSDIIAIIVGIITIRKNIIKSKWSKFLIGFFVGIAGLTTVYTIVLFTIDVLTHPDEGITVTNIAGDYHNDTINFYYSPAAGGGYTNVDVTTAPSASSTWDGNNEEWQTYSYQYVNEHDVGITFNSIKVAETDAAWAEKNGLELPLLGNETNFVGAREDTGKNEGAKNVWEGSNIAAEDGKTYIVRLYVHNNSSGDMNAVAEDTQVRFYVPFGSAATQTVSGWLQSSNAAPNQYSDTVNFNSTNGTPFHLEYVSGSALLENGGFAKGNGVQLPDSITNQGNPTNKAENEWTLIGYDALDGRIPGCYKYINYVSIKVKVVYD